MYCAYDDEKNIIAFHDDREVVEDYVMTIYSLHKVQLDVGKVKKSSKYKLKGLDDLYLVRYGKTYVQSGYLVYLQIAGNGLMEDDKYALGVLYRLLEVQRLTPKQVKKIKAAIEVLEDVLHEDATWVPTLKDLKTMKMDYDPYLYNSGLYEL